MRSMASCSFVIGKLLPGLKRFLADCKSSHVNCESNLVHGSLFDSSAASPTIGVLFHHPSVALNKTSVPCINNPSFGL
jgi:hypothetical protein